MYRVVFEHHLKQGQEALFIKQWQAGSDEIQTYPGARGTKLFRSTVDPNILYAMAEWDDKKARDAAMKAINLRKDAQWVLHAHEEFIEEYRIVAAGELVASSESSRTDY